MIPLEYLEYAGWIATLIAIAGVVLNNGRKRSCFILWFFSNGLTAIIHASTNPVVYGLIVRDLVFFALAIVGYIQWGRAARK